MGLEKYRQYKDNFLDDGLEISVSMGQEFVPDFFNRNTIQIWNVGAVESARVNKWVGNTLTERTSHEISIVNNSNATKVVSFASLYSFPDDVSLDGHTVTIGPNGTAYFYATAIFKGGNLIMVLRTGSQDDRKIIAQ